MIIITDNKRKYIGLCIWLDAAKIPRKGRKIRLTKYEIDDLPVDCRASNMVLGFEIVKAE